MSEQSVFTRIINGEIPCHKIYEDDRTFAFLDIHPKQPGHVLVVPKMQVDSLWELPPEVYDSVMQATKKVALRIQDVLSPPRIGMQVEGLDIPHAHVHVFPFATSPEYHVIPDQSLEPDHQVLAEMAKLLAF